MTRNAFVTLLLSVFIALLGVGIVVPVMPVFAQELGAGGLALGMIIAAFSVTRSVLQPVIGSYSDRVDRKIFLASGIFIYGLVGLLIPHAASVVQLIIIRAFHGVGSAMIVPIAMAYMSLFSPPGQEGKYMSYLNMAIFTGIGCGPIIGGFFVDFWGMASVFHAMAVLSFCAFILVIFNMPASQAGESRSVRTILLQFASMLRNCRTRGVLLARYATMVMMVPTMAFLPLLMHDWPDNTGLRVGLVIACRTLTNAVLQVPFGKRADRRSKLWQLVLGCLGLAGALFCIPQINSFAGMIAIYMFLGMSEAAVWAVLGAYASIEAKTGYGHGTMMGAFAFAMSAGVFTGALLSGLSMDGWGITRAYQVCAAALVVLVSIAAMLIHKGNIMARQ